VVAAPGQTFEVVDVERDGVTNREFKNSPENLRQFFDPARGVDQTFLVYETRNGPLTPSCVKWTLWLRLVHHYG